MSEIEWWCISCLRKSFKRSRDILLYDPTHYQPVLFCANLFDAMYGTLRDFLMRWK